MTRLLKSKIGPDARSDLMDSQSWISSGVLTDSTLIKAKGGVLGGILVTAYDSGGDIYLELYDTNTTPVMADVCLCEIQITTPIEGAQVYWIAPSQVGVQFENSLYLLKETGDFGAIVYYR
jgi:hypothetical protein